MKVVTGFEKIYHTIPAALKGKSIAVLCHAPSVSSDFTHISEWASDHSALRFSALFGPQHGLFGQTQDNMIEWEAEEEGGTHLRTYSLYGSHRKPTPEMLAGIEAFIIDLQDIGARPYTYIWSMKHCMEACGEAGIPVWVLDRPNPVGGLGIEGPLLRRDHFTFVGGAELPMMHSMTIGEIAVWLRDIEGVRCDLNVIWMEGYSRGMMYNQTGLPWVIPSPNMPVLQTAVVYPGMVLVEALNLSEARGTTTPFELFGAPGLDIKSTLRSLRAKRLPGCSFRQHDYIPTFNKYSGEYCSGIMIHVTDPSLYRPFYTAIEIFSSIIECNPGYLTFNPPPYEYEYNLMPFDILAGDGRTREALREGRNIRFEMERWNEELKPFIKTVSETGYYR